MWFFFYVVFRAKPLFIFHKTRLSNKTVKSNLVTLCLFVGLFYLFRTLSGVLFFELQVRGNWESLGIMDIYKTRPYLVIFISLDTNDFKPVFSTNQHNKRIDENIKINTPILKVLATDQDSGTSGQIIYTITRQENDNAFYIDSNTGTFDLSR